MSKKKKKNKSKYIIVVSCNDSKSERPITNVTIHNHLQPNKTVIQYAEEYLETGKPALRFKDKESAEYVRYLLSKIPKPTDRNAYFYSTKLIKC